MLLSLRPFRIAPAILLATIVATAASAAEPVTVTVNSGRTFTGLVDEQTSSQTLVLRFEGMATTLWRNIAWSQIRAAQHAGRELSANELQQLASQIATRKSKAEAATPANAEPKTHESQAQQAQAALFPQPAPVRSLQAEAHLANWDGDVEKDGLLLLIQPIDSYGQMTPVAGMLNVDLVGTRPASFRSRQVYHRGSPFPSLGTWTVRLSPAQFGPEGAVVRLPFQAKHPEFDSLLGSHGLVHVQLVVPGQGVMETSIGLVRVRPYSAVRDAREQLQHSRFFPQERTGHLGR